MDLNRFGLPLHVCLPGIPGNTRSSRAFGRNWTQGDYYTHIYVFFLPFLVADCVIASPTRSFEWGALSNITLDGIVSSGALGSTP